MGAGGYLLYQRTLQASRDRQVEALAAAGFDQGALERALADCGATCPADAAAEARSRLAVLAAEAQRYRAAQGDPGKLRAYAGECKACVFKTEALEAALGAEKRDADRKRLELELAAAGVSRAALDRFVADCGESCPVDLAAQARSRLDVLAAEEARYREAQDDPDRLRGYIAGCKACVFKGEAQATLEQDERKRLAAERTRLAAELAAAGTSRAALEQFVADCGTACPADLAAEARSRLDALAAEEARYREARDDPERLRAYLRECRACVFKGEAQARLEQDERKRQEDRTRLSTQLSNAATSKAALEQFIAGCGTACPADLAAEARSRLDALAAEEARYREAQDDPDRLRGYIEECKACVFKGEAQARLEQDERKRQPADDRTRLSAELAAAGVDRAALEKFIADCGEACPADLTAEARSHLDALVADEARYREAQDDPERLRGYIKECNDCIFKGEAQATLEQIEQKRRAETERTGRSAELSAAGTSRAALEKFIGDCGADACPADLAAEARSRLDAAVAKETRYRDALGDARYDRSALEALIADCGDGCPPEVSAEARSRVSVINNEAAQFAAAGNDTDRLRAYISNCTACNFKIAAVEAMRELEVKRQLTLNRERFVGLLERAKFQYDALMQFQEACGASCPEDLAAVARSRLDVLRKEEVAYRNARGSLAELRAYIRDCAACVYKDEATARVEEKEDDARRQEYQARERERQRQLAQEQHKGTAPLPAPGAKTSRSSKAKEIGLLRVQRGTVLPMNAHSEFGRITIFRLFWFHRLLLIGEGLLMDMELPRNPAAALLAALLAGWASGAMAELEGVQGLVSQEIQGMFSVKVDRGHSSAGDPGSSPDPSTVLAFATAVVGGSALELRCIEGRLSVVIANLGVFAKRFEPFEVEVVTDKRVTGVFRGLGNDETGLTAGAIDIDDAGAVLDDLATAKVVDFKTTSQAGAKTDIVIPLFGQAADAVGEIKRLCAGGPRDDRSKGKEPACFVFNGERFCR